MLYILLHQQILQQNFNFRVCVGISIAPNDNDDWFCRVCVAKRKLHGLDKKKKRNKKK